MKNFYFFSFHDIAKIVMFLREELTKGLKSKWYPYLRLIPKDFSNMAVTFDFNKYYRYLQGTSFLKQIHDNLNQTANDYMILKNELPEETKDLPFKQYLNLKLFTESRLFGTTHNGKEYRIFVPFIGKKVI